MKEQHDRYDRLAVRLSVIISRLLAGHALVLKTLADEFGVSERTLQRDFQQRLIHLGIEYSAGAYRLARRPLRPHLPDTFTFINNTGISGIIPTQNRKLIRLLTSTSGISPCLIGHGGLPSAVTQSAPFLLLAEAIRDHRTVTLQVNGRSHETVAPHRLIFQSKSWFLVTTRARTLQVFRMEEINAVTVLETSFRNKPELDALTASEEFISALPHFRFISNVIHSFRGSSPEASPRLNGVNS
ncbi:helix-turn-helix transcriptional regulator [Enterobacter asburiae]|uniref:helix-turn-helix transcriptional regulator n=1 Tax=Enterobacter asburiae TaxID=61645 RepID=UPI0021CFDE7A|nr:WYL domain-containing protein [Enterobacter asburiae]MCU6244156.1 WYL domain-containing protein [Enterobacter asburiae]